MEGEARSKDWKPLAIVVVGLLVLFSPFLILAGREAVDFFTPESKATVPAAKVDGPVVSALLYHAISDGRDLVPADKAYSVSPDAFEKQMKLLKRSGFRTIGMRRLAAFHDGNLRGLPRRPAAVTFDDGLLSSWKGSDSVLRKLGFRGAMFLDLGRINRDPQYMNWDQVREMYKSGRWDVDVHAGLLHKSIRYGPLPREFGPAYAYRAVGETFGGWKRRVSNDLEWAIRKMRSELPGWEPTAWAVPYGSYGQISSNDRRIAPSLIDFAGRLFPVIFGGACGPFIVPDEPLPFNRLEVKNGVTESQLGASLATGRPPAGTIDPNDCGRREPVLDKPVR